MYNKVTYTDNPLESSAPQPLSSRSQTPSSATLPSSSPSGSGELQHKHTQTQQDAAPYHKSAHFAILSIPPAPIPAGQSQIENVHGTPSARHAPNLHPRPPKRRSLEFTLGFTIPAPATAHRCVCWRHLQISGLPRLSVVRIEDVIPIVARGSISIVLSRSPLKRLNSAES